MKPILFNSEMLQSIIDGQKTQTRRPLKKQPPKNYYFGGVNTSNNKLCFSIEKDSSKIDFVSDKLNVFKGDVLYIRETWAKYNDLYVYKSVEEHKKYFEVNKLAWKPSIHMPKEAARVFLRIINVKLERLEEITKEDAIAEGTRSIMDFKSCWDVIYKKYLTMDNPWVLVYEFEKISKQEMAGANNA